MLNFKKLVLGAAVALVIPASQAATSPMSMQGVTNAKPFNMLTAPDSVSRQVLAVPMSRIDEGAAPGTDATAIIHSNFSQIIEQNFARLDAAGTTALLDNLSETELADLAQHYNTANADSGHADRLLPILATRLDNAHLVRLSHHFGYAPVYTALLNHAPQLAARFSVTATPSDVALPVHTAALGALALSPNAPMFAPRTLGTGDGGKLRPEANPIIRYYNWAPGDVYLDLRTAPIGAMGANAAILETGAIYFGGAALAWQAGQTAGGYLNTLLETYTPNLYNDIGGTIDQMFQNFQQATTQFNQGQILSGIGSIFGLSGSESTPMARSGGDYQSTATWADFSGGSNAGCPDAVRAPRNGDLSPDLWHTSC